MPILTTTSHFDTNPGRAGTGKGKQWAPTEHDSLLLPSGKSVGDTPDPELRTELDRLGIPGAHTAGRNIIAARYAARLREVFDAAGNAAMRIGYKKIGAEMVYQITTNIIDGRKRTIDLHQVKIPGSNVRAVQLPQLDLYRAIKDFVPDATPTMGWQELALRLGIWIEQQQEPAE